MKCDKCHNSKNNFGVIIKTPLMFDVYVWDREFSSFLYFSECSKCSHLTKYTKSEPEGYMVYFMQEEIVKAMREFRKHLVETGYMYNE